MAKRFQFRLTSLLKLRKSLEEEAQRHLAKMMAARNEADEALNALRQAAEDTVEGKRVGDGQPVNLERLRAVERFLVVLERRISNAADQLAQAEMRVTDARKALAKAHQAHLTLLRLKERRMEQHALEVLQEEARNADELAVLRYRFNTRAREVSS